MSPGDDGEGASAVEQARHCDMLRLLDVLPDSVIIVDAGGIIVWGNDTAERLFGTTISQVAGLSGLDFVHPEDLPFVLLSLETVQDKEVGSPIEVRLRTPAGWRLIELVGTPVPWLAEGAVCLSLRDLTERRRFEVAHNRDARLRSVVQNAAVVTLLVAPDGTVLSSSGAMSRMLGHDPEMIERRPFVNLVASEDRQAVMGAIVRTGRLVPSTTPVTVTVGLNTNAGPLPIPFELTIVNLLDDPTVEGYVITAHDVSERKRLEEELKYQAFHDPLTGLGNRALFLDRLGHSLEKATRANRPISALFLDLDTLKSANDQLGHAAGDRLLQAMAGVLVGSVRRSDTAARLGGDEFGVIVEEFTYPREVEALADRIADACRAPLAFDTCVLSGTVSIGFAFSRPGITVDELMSNADRAMYAAKDRGKDRSERFESWML